MTKRITILVADDHPLFRRGLIDVLKTDAELDVCCEAGDGHAALQLIEQRKPNVAVLDVQMPKASGIEIAKAMQRKRLPVALVFLTMFDDEETFNEALELGVKGYVLKESAATDILSCIKTVAAGKYFVSPSLSGFLVNRGAGVAALQKEKPGLSGLTPAERRILKLIASDQTSKEIADQLSVSPRTVETHRQNIAQKLELHGTHSLLKFAFENKSRL